MTNLQNCRRSGRRCHQVGGRPIARSSHSSSFYDGSLYVYGGEHVARTPIDSTVWIYTQTQNTWRELGTKGPQPEPRVAHAQAVVGDDLYIMGGRQGVDLGDGDLNDLHKVSLRTGAWTAVAPRGTPPSPRSFHQGCAAGGKLYIFGGCPGHSRVSDLHVYDPQANAWSQLPDQGMRGRGGAGFTADAAGENLYVLAGFAGEETNDCYKYEITTSTWTTIPSNALRPRSVFGLSALNNGIVIFGGEVDPSAQGHSGAGDFAADLVFLNTSSLEFSTIEVGGTVPTGRGWTRIAADSDHSFLLFGGLAGNDENPMRLDDVWTCKLSGA